MIELNETQERRGAAYGCQKDLTAEDIQVQDVNVKTEWKDGTVARRTHVLEPILCRHFVNCAHDTGGAAISPISRRELCTQRTPSHAAHAPDRAEIWSSSL